MSPLTLCVFLLAIGSFGSCNKGKQRFRTACLEESKLSETELNALPQTDMKKKCFHACRFEKRGIISNGMFSGKATPCQDLQDDNKCELAAKVFECLKQARSQLKKDKQ